jgi:hypothetical protein
MDEVKIHILQAELTIDYSSSSTWDETLKVTA